MKRIGQRRRMAEDEVHWISSCEEEEEVEEEADDDRNGFVRIKKSREFKTKGKRTKHWLHNARHTD